MSSSRPHRRVVLTGLAALAGCGFTPAYGPGGAARGLTGTISVAAPKDRDSFGFVKQLELRLGQPSPARYALDYSIKVQQDGVGLTSTQETTRYNIVGTATFSVKDVADGEVLTSGQVNTFTGYSVGTVDTTASPPSTSSTVSTRAAEQDARDRLMLALADEVVNRLVATSGAWTR